MLLKILHNATKVILYVHLYAYTSRHLVSHYKKSYENWSQPTTRAHAMGKKNWVDGRNVVYIVLPFLQQHSKCYNGKISSSVDQLIKEL
jgi:hypothetical protein